MSYQTIIDNATQIKFNRTRIGGHTMTRSGILRTSSLASYVPWTFTVSPSPGMLWADVRDVVEDVQTQHFTGTPGHAINLGGTNPGLAYITEYQGEYTQAQLNQAFPTSASALEITLDVSNVVGDTSATVIFRKGDYLSFTGYRYPYVVTSDVIRGLNSTVTVPINRPWITQSGFSLGSGVDPVVGVNVTWDVVMVQKPDYMMIPGKRVQFDGDFIFQEVIQ